MTNSINTLNSNVQNKQIPTNNTTITKEPSGKTVTTNNTAEFKESIDKFHANVLTNCSDIKKNRTVNIFTHNMKKNAGWSNFKQVFKNIGRNIGVLARAVTGNGTDASKSEVELRENLSTMQKMMSDLNEDNFKDFFNFLCENNCADYLSVLRNCEQQLEKLGIKDASIKGDCEECLRAIRTKSNEMRNFIIEQPDIKALKQLMDETKELLETGTKKGYEDALRNLATLEEKENLIKGYNALITDANKDRLPNNAKPLLCGDRSEYKKIIEDIKNVRNTGYLKDLHAPDYFYSGREYKDPIREALCAFGRKAYQDRKNLLEGHALIEMGTTLPANGENKGKPTDIGGTNGYSVYDLKIDDPDFVDKYQKTNTILRDAEWNLGQAKISDTGGDNEELDKMVEKLQDLRAAYQLYYHIDPETGKSTRWGMNKG